MIESSQQHWLILSHAYNQDGSAASITITDKIPALLKANIAVTVISARTGEVDTRVKHIQCLPIGPSGLRFDLRHVIARRWGQGFRYRLTTLLISVLLLLFIVFERMAFGLSNHASWTGSAVLQGLRAIRYQRPTIIYSSGGAASAHHAAAILSKRTGIPWIAEIHDPLVERTSPDDQGTARRPTRNSRYLARVEALICERAQMAWWFTEAALEHARYRHPGLSERGHVILPGCLQPDVHPCETHAYSDRLTLCHFGSLSNERSLAPLVRAMLAMSAAGSEIVADIDIVLYGTSKDDRTHSLLQANPGGPICIHDRGRIDRVDAMAAMQRADALLLIHSDGELGPETIPSKVYEYFWIRRPVFAVTNRNPRLDNMVSHYEGFVCSEHDEASIVAALNRCHQQWKSRQLNPHSQAPVSVDDAVRQIASGVDSIVGEDKPTIT